jgi:hypothetical protein
VGLAHPIMLVTLLMFELLQIVGNTSRSQLQRLVSRTPHHSLVLLITASTDTYVAMPTNFMSANFRSPLTVWFHHISIQMSTFATSQLLTTKLTCRYGAQRNSGQVQRLVSPLSVISQNPNDRFDSNILKIPASTVSSNLRANKP